MKPKKVKLKKCKACTGKFEPWNSTQAVCSPACAVAWTRAKKKKAEEKRNRKAVREFRANDRSYRLRQAQMWFNKFIRMRDNDLPCISCGRHHQGQYHAGHYKSVKASPELRFYENNCHKQCSHCNNFQSGNLSLYRENLLQKIGQEELEFIEGPHKQKHYTIEEIWEIERKYKKLCKEMTFEA